MITDSERMKDRNRGINLHSGGKHGKEVARDVDGLRDEDLEGHAERIERDRDVARRAQRKHDSQEFAKVSDGAEDGFKQPADIAVGVAVVPRWHSGRSDCERCAKALKGNLRLAFSVVPST